MLIQDQIVKRRGDGANWGQPTRCYRKALIRERLPSPQILTCLVPCHYFLTRTYTYICASTYPVLHAQGIYTHSAPHLQTSQSPDLVHPDPASTDHIKTPCSGPSDLSVVYPNRAHESGPDTGSQLKKMKYCGFWNL